MIDLRQQVIDYVALRRSLGFKLRGHDRLLADFVDYLDRMGASTVTSQLALAWATKPTNVQPLWRKKRLSVVCGFSRYLHTLDPSVEVPVPDLLAYRYQRPTPYLYSETEIASLIDAAGTLSPPLRAMTYQAMFGLLAVTGMRLSEANRDSHTMLTLRSRNGSGFVIPGTRLLARRWKYTAGTAAAVSTTWSCGCGMARWLRSPRGWLTPPGAEE